MYRIHNVSHGTDREQMVRVEARGTSNDILYPGERGNYPDVKNLGELVEVCAVFRNGERVYADKLQVDRKGPKGMETNGGGSEDSNEDRQQSENDSVEVTTSEQDYSEAEDSYTEAELEELGEDELKELAESEGVEYYWSKNSETLIEDIINL